MLSCSEPQSSLVFGLCSHDEAVPYHVCVQGFIVNRILMPMINEAFFALMEVRRHASCHFATAFRINT